MKRIQLGGVGVESAAQSAAAALRAGGVVLYPTDTVYGLGADAFSDEAVAEVYTIKGRDEKKPIHCVVSDMAMAEHYSDISPYARLLAEAFWPGALTLVLKKKSDVDSGIVKGIETIGIRIPNNEFCLALAREYGAPYTTTSANKAGVETAPTVDKILEQLGNPKIELVVDAGELPGSRPSTVVDVSGSEPRILREGAIPAEKITKILENSAQ